MHSRNGVLEAPPSSSKSLNSGPDKGISYIDLETNSESLKGKPLKKFTSLRVEV